MKKLITLLLTVTFISNSFGMLTRKIITRTTQRRSIYIHDDHKERNNILKQNIDTLKSAVECRQLVKNRQQIKEKNLILMHYITEQNKVIDQLNEYDRTMTRFEYFLSENQITDLAQKLFDLEQEIRK
jgi:hypothetical protein